MINQRAIDEFLSRVLGDYSWLKTCGREELDQALGELIPKPDFGLIKPWDHQKVGLLLCLELKRYMLHWEMGGGKTLLTLMLLKYRKQCGEKPKAIVFVPYLTAVDTWVEEVKKHAPDLRCIPLLGSGRDNLHALRCDNGDLYIVCYQSAVSMVSEEVKGKNGKTKWQLSAKQVREYFAGFDTLVLDEIHKCFVKGTPITTNIGSKQIEDLKIGDFVESGVGLRPITQIFASEALNIVKLVFANGKVLECTQEHPFMTDDGWVEAKFLEGKFVYGETSSSSVCLVRKLLWGHYLRSKQWTKILWNKLFCQMENAATQCKESNLYANVARKSKQIPADVCSNQSWEEACSGTQCPHERKQSSQKIRCGSKDFKNAPIAWAWLWKKPWGQWSWAYKAPEVALGCLGWGRWELAARVRNFTWKSSSWLPYLLQNRFSVPPTKDSNRIRRIQNSQDSTDTLKERYKVGRTRVVSVSIKKQRHPVTVYNIEVGDTPHYFANGILVHNCKTVTSLTYRMCRAISAQCEYVLGLTGTPFGKDLEDLWPQFYLIDFGETLGPTLGFYRAAFFKQKVNFWGGYDYTFNKKLMPVLKQVIKNRSIHYSINEFFDMPEKKYIVRNLPAPPDSEAYCKASIKAIREAHKGEGNFQAIESNYLKLRQLSSGFMTLKGEDNDKLQLQFASNPKLEVLVEAIESLPLGAKCVCFHHFVFSNELISSRLQELKIGHARIWGGQKDPIGQLKKFRDDPNCQVLVINVKSGSSSLNLQFANYLIFFEQPDSPIDRSQAEARVWRPGQKNRVFIYDLLVRDTVDFQLHQANKMGKKLLAELLTGNIKL